jgi:hypothetical protein
MKKACCFILCPPAKKTSASSDKEVADRDQRAALRDAVLHFLDEASNMSTTLDGPQHETALVHYSSE